MRSNNKNAKEFMNLFLSKKVVAAVCVIFSTFSYAQVIIGGSTGTAPASKKSAVLLEFEAGENKGIILPYNRTLPSGSGLAEGTITVDATVPTAAKVKYYAPGNSIADSDGWVDLSSGSTADLASVLAKQPLSTGPNAVAEDPNAKAVIGANTSSANGVLVLESKSKVLVLPQVATTDDVKNPAPGMMVYLKGPQKRLAVYNGAKWTFWAP